MNESKNVFSPRYGIKELKFKDFNITKGSKKVNDSMFKKKNGLIIFYSHFCKHCIDSSELWINIAINYMYKINIAAVNCYNIKDENEKLVPLLHIDRFPTIKIVKDGNLYDTDLKKITYENISFLIETNF
jgi:thiol-disulfide isomerase/thioredoxin